MEEYDDIDPDYIKGFNEGYLISQHMPDIAESLAKAYGGGTRAEGFKQGKEQYNSEQLEQRLPSWLKQNPKTFQNKDAQKNKGLNRDIEPDR